MARGKAAVLLCRPRVQCPPMTDNGVALLRGMLHGSVILQTVEVCMSSFQTAIWHHCRDAVTDIWANACRLFYQIQILRRLKKHRGWTAAQMFYMYIALQKSCRGSAL